MSWNVEHDVDLSHANTMALPCVAVRRVRVLDEHALCQAIETLRLSAEEVVVLGGGSNILLPPRLQKTVLQIDAAELRVVASSATYADIDVDAGMNWDDLVSHSVKQGWYGIENLSAIPGRVGAAPVQNIGAYGVELADVLLQVEAYDFARQGVVTLPREACLFAYRDSVFKQQAGRFVIFRVRLRLATDPRFHLDYGPLQSLREHAHLTLAAVRERVCAVRAEKLPDPRVSPNVGSFFKNPLVSVAQHAALRQRHPDLVSYATSDPAYVKLAAGWLIEKAGWKGQVRDGVAVHAQQALVLVNCGGAGLAEVLALAEAIRTSILERFGISLEREPVLLEAPYSAA